MAKRRPLDGEYAELRILADWLRTVADVRHQSLRALERRIPYGRSTISEKLSGRRCPEWAFVEAFVRGCAPDDLQAQHLLIEKVRPLWEAANQPQLTPLPARAQEGGQPLTDPATLELVPDQMQAIVTSLGEIAAKQDLLARAQLSLSHGQELTTGLLGIRDALDIAVQTLSAERDALRGERDRLHAELSRHSDLREQLETVRAQLAQTQTKLEAAYQLQADTERRLREAERQRSTAEQLRLRAARQLQEAVTTITGSENSSDGTVDNADTDAVAPAADLLGPVDQQIAHDMLARADDALAAQEHDLAALSADLNPPGDGARTSPRVIDETALTRLDTSRTLTSAIRNSMRLWLSILILFALILMLYRPWEGDKTPNTAPSTPAPSIAEFDIQIPPSEAAKDHYATAVEAVETQMTKRGYKDVRVWLVQVFASGSADQAMSQAQGLAQALTTRSTMFRNARQESYWTSADNGFKLKIYYLP